MASNPRMSANPASAPKISTIFTVIQRSGLTVCVQASRWVPASYSRETSGAAQNIPASSGIAMSAAVNGGMVWKARCRASKALLQSPPAAVHAGQAEPAGPAPRD